MSATTITHPKDLPAVKAATSAVEEAARKLEIARERFERFTALLQPRDDREPVDPVDRLEAEAGIINARIEVAKLEREVLTAQRAAATAKDHAREQLRLQFIVQERRAVSDFKKKLLECRTLNEEVKRVQFAKHEALNEPFDPLSWFEFTARLDEWMKRVHAYGLDE